MDKIQSSKTKKQSSYSRSAFCDSPVAATPPTATLSPQPTFGSSSSFALPARISNNVGLFSSTTPTTPVLSTTPVAKPQNVESNPSFFMTNPKYQGMQASPWTLQYRLDNIANAVNFDIFPLSACGFDVEYQVSVIGGDGGIVESSEVMKKKGSEVWQQQIHCNFTTGFSIPMTSLSSEADKYFWDKGHLVIKVSVFIGQPEVMRSDHVNEKRESTTSSSKFNKMVEDLKDMFETMKGSDVVIEAIDGVKLDAHKAFLMARSVTFDKMFGIEMTEKETGNVIVKDFNSTVMTELLRFIYYNEVENMVDVDIDLYKAAMRYEVKELPEMCLQSIVNNIHKKDILEVIALADIYGLKELFKSSVNIFMANFKRHKNSIEWSNLDSNFKMKILNCVAEIHYTSLKVMMTG